MKLFSCIFLTTLLMTGCTRDDNSKINKNFFGEMMKSSGETADSEIFIYYSGMNSKVGSFTVSANLYDSSETFVSGAQIDVEGYKIPETSTTGNFHKTFFPGETENNILKSSLGDSLTLDISKYYDLDVSSAVYFPSQVKFSKIVNGYDLDRNNDLTLEWATDPNNSNNIIGIMMLYRGLQSNRLSSSNSKTANYQILTTTDDDGSHTFSSNKLLNEFPANSFVHIYLIRGSSRIISDYRTGDGIIDIEVVTFNQDGQSVIFRY
ncbi:MAG: hypothetical protein LC664_06955 [Flavobacteriales bacterium]|nr:hypothetical protein [Flavobacteriales bacterium]